MTKNTESLISACHELARTASCDDYLILNKIVDKLRFLRKERDSYKEMFFDSCKGLAAIARAAGIKEENDTGSPGQVIEKIESMLNIDWNFTEHPAIKVGEEMKCWVYVERTIQRFDYCDLDENGKAQYHYHPVEYKRYVTTLTYQNKPSPTGEHILSRHDDIPEWATQNDVYDWIHSVCWCLEYNHPDHAYYYEELDKNIQVLAWAEFIHPAAPEIKNVN
ncbi:hypothetical protein QPK14_20005 [Photorhabdus temperata subsp. temperata]